VVLDQVIIHSRRAVQARLLFHPQLPLCYSARYCPHANPVERIRGTLKRHLANSPPPTMAGRFTQAATFFRQRTPEQMLYTAAPENAPWFPKHYGQNLWRAA